MDKEDGKRIEKGQKELETFQKAKKGPRKPEKE